MPHVIRVVGSGFGLLDPQAEVYLKNFDIEANGGLGDWDYTDDVAQAHRFETGAAALEAWRSQSVTRPYRPDGKPNRPLTALSIEVFAVD